MKDLEGEISAESNVKLPELSPWAVGLVLGLLGVLIASVSVESLHGAAGNSAWKLDPAAIYGAFAYAGPDWGFYF